MLGLLAGSVVVGGDTSFTVATLVFWTTVFSDLELKTGLKESSENFTGDGLKVSAW